MFFLPPALDLKLFVLINQHWRSEILDIIMPILSSMTVLMVVMSVALLFALWKGGKRQALFFLILLIGMGVSDFSTYQVKKQIQRVRPLNAVAGTHHQANGPWEQRPMDFVQTKTKGTSYPSGHSANTMCLAVLAIFLWPALKKWPLILPLLVGYSRVYLGKHYPTDVLGGWLFGLIIACTVWLVWKHGISRYVFKD